MNIGYVLNTFPVLSESFILNEITTLIEMGHNVTVFSILPSRDPINHTDVERYGLVERTHYFIRRNRVKDFARVGRYSIGAFGWTFPAENLSSRIAIPASKYFSKIAEGMNLDLLHAHFNGVSSQTAMLMSKRLNVPFTFTAHAIDIFRHPKVSALRKRMSESIAVITISNFNKQYLHELTGVDNKKIRVIHACPKLISSKNGNGEKANKRVLTIARLVEKKGIKYAIMSMKEVLAKHPDVEYRIVGTGPLERELKNLSNSMGCERNVTFLGSQNDSILATELGKASLFVLPCVRASDGDMDGIPVSLMEAMYAMTPVVATDISGIPELVEHGREGFLTEPEDTKAISQAIDMLLEDKDLQIRMGKHGRKKIEEEFNIHAEVSKMINLWTDILEHSSTKRFS